MKNFTFEEPQIQHNSSGSQLKKLKKLEIKDCKNYEGGLEYLIENMPSLRKVILVNIELEKYFEEKMKKINPNLTFEVYFQHDEIIEQGILIEGFEKK